VVIDVSSAICVCVCEAHIGSGCCLCAGVLFSMLLSGIFAFVQRLLHRSRSGLAANFFGYFVGIAVNMESMIAFALSVPVSMCDGISMQIVANFVSVWMPMFIRDPAVIVVMMQFLPMVFR